MINKIIKNHAYACLLICFLVLLWRSFKGFCWTDESFYISTADRFIKGDIPLVDEWFRTQMSSILMVPFYAVYRLIVGSNTGIVLYFRILYLLLSSATAIVYFRVLRKEYPDAVALVSALFVMCYAHLNITSFSYYMLSELFLALALIIIHDYRNTGKRYTLVIAGVCIAFSVMCMPVFAVGYFIVMAAVIAAMIVSRTGRVPEKIRNAIKELKLWDITVYTVIGILIPAVLFAVYVLSHVDMARLFDTLPYMLIDKEHNESWGYFIRKPHRCLMDVFGIYTYGSYILIAVSFIFSKYLKKHPLQEITAVSAVIVFALQAYMAWGHTGYIQVAFFMFALPVFFVSEKKNHALFWLMVIPATLVAAIFCFSSSDFLYVIAIGCAIGTSAGVCALYDFAKGNGRIVSVLVGIACVFSLFVTFTLRIVNVYRDAPLDKLTEVIPTGVAKGLYTTEEHLLQYLDVYEVIDEYCRGERILISKVLPWGYAATDMRCGYPTTWRSTAYDEEQLDKYYSYNEVAKPDVILILNEEYGSFDASGDVEDDHNPNLDELGTYWKDYITTSGMKEIRVKCGRIYTTH